jgi:F-type H+-transporting ATPase subunit alpha
LNRGQHLQEILKQPQYEPMSLENQVIEIFAGTNGYADDVDIDRMRAWEVALLRYMETSHPEIGKAISEEKRLSPETEENLRAALASFNSTWQ